MEKGGWLRPREKKSNLEGPRELFREIPPWKSIYRYK